MPLKIMLITGSYPPMKCGVGAYTRRLVMALAELSDVRITVLTDERASGVADQEGVEVLPVIRGWRITELVRIAKHVQQSNPDIVHIQYPTQGYSGRTPILLPLLMRLLGKPCVQTWHEPMPRRVGLLLAIGLDVLIAVREQLISSLPKLIQKILRMTRVVWIPAASLLPTVVLNDEERLKIWHQYVSGNEILLSFYGFVAPLKGIEMLFEVVARTNARLLMVCDIREDDYYHKSLLDKITVMGIQSRVNIMGFLPDEQLATILAASDAVVFPFRDGAGAWNTSIDGAIAQGVFVLTTSYTVNGYNKEKNIYFVKPSAVEEMIAAIQRYAGYRIRPKPSMLEWQNIAEQHIGIYRKLICK